MIKLKAIWNIVRGRSVIYKANINGTVEPQTNDSVIFDNIAL